MRAIMSSPYDTRRYLTNFDSARVGNILTDVLVIGSGVAGMRAAIEAADHCMVTLVTKSDFDHSATNIAQGGIAAAISETDSTASHLEDTLRVGCGLCRHEAVELLVNEGPARLEELLSWGMNLDEDDGALAMGREGGHSQNRILHAHGDQTGRELVRTLKAKVLESDNIRLFEQCYLIDLLTVDERCVGAVVYHEQHGHQLIWASRTILATGGCGKLWRETTNPTVSSGDGAAAAFRVGAKLCSLEMMQFHPTTLYVAGAGRALITEAVRGEGAYLVDRAGHRFMCEADPAGELAPRDIVSRAIHHHLADTRANCVYLDVRHIAGFRQRFPHIAKLCGDFEIDVTEELIPVRPSAHYMIGGIDVALDGSTSVRGLLACGEVAATGVHGANRLASNSLLEGLVFGRLAGLTAGEAAGKTQPGRVPRIVNKNMQSNRTELNLADILNSLRSVMWRNVGIVRRGERLAETCEILDFWGHYTLDKTLDGPEGWEVQNLLTVARLVAKSALQRDDSVGVHFRSDAADGTPSAAYQVSTERNPDGTEPVRIALATT